MLVAARRTEGLNERGTRCLGASAMGGSWLPLRLPIRYQKGLKPPLLATRIRRKYLALSAGYELLSKLQNLYAPVRSRPAPPNFPIKTNLSGCLDQYSLFVPIRSKRAGNRPDLIAGGGQVPRHVVADHDALRRHAKWAQKPSKGDQDGRGSDE